MSPVKSLYEITGKITDINIVCLSREEYNKLIQAEEPVAWRVWVGSTEPDENEYVYSEYEYGEPLCRRLP